MKSLYWALVSLLFLPACGKLQPLGGTPSEIEGIWTNACASLRSIAEFKGDTFKLDLVGYSDSTCYVKTGRSTLMSGTFKIAGSATEPSGAKNLNLTSSASKIYTVYQLTGGSLNFILNNSDPDHDGSSETKRINILGSPLQRQ